MDNVWTLILAAGASTRFGSIKALAPWQDGTLLSAALDTAHTVCHDKVMVVTGAHHAALLPHLESCKPIWNQDWTRGMGSSIACGIGSIERLDRTAEIIIILPVDQPFATAAHLQALAEQAFSTQKLVFTSDGSIIGPPAALPRSMFEAAQQIPADKGLKALTDRTTSSIFHATALKDIDTIEDLILYSAY